jgi:polyphosphate kinase 2
MSDDERDPRDTNGHYAQSLYELQVELVKLQRTLIEDGIRVLVIFEGRDGAGKDGSIKRLSEHMSPRDTRIHAPGIPSSREETQWYFQRFARHLPAAAEFVIFNRSWYNRAGVERVMGFCTADQLREFYGAVVPFETMLVRDGIALRKYYLDITRREQKHRLKAREDDPLKQWKSSPVDAVAVKNWRNYTKARDEMFRRTHHEDGPWHVVRADVKKTARLELIRDLLASFDYKHKSKKLDAPNRDVVFPWSEERAVLLAP